jgi:hypothetical protein
MAAVANTKGSGPMGGSENGQLFKCPDCGTEVVIRDKAALFIGGVISAFWLAVGYWAFLKGPYWYATGFATLISGDRDTDFLIIDIFVLLLSLGAMALSVWVFWIFLLSPLRKRLRNPISQDIR